MRVSRTLCFQSLLLLLVAAYASCKPKMKEAPSSLMVFAAASLSDVMAEVGDEFERSRGSAVEFNFSGSNTLAQQMAATDRADVFLSANEEWMSWAVSKGEILESSIKDIALNQLAVVSDPAFTMEATSWSDIKSSDVEKLVIADPRGVPAGQYAKRWMERHGVWESLSDSVVPTTDVRAVMAVVRSTKMSIGIVYSSDLTNGVDRLGTLFSSNEDDDLNIRYQGGLSLKESLHPLAGDFLSFLGSEEGCSIFRKHGFIVEEGDQDD